MKTDEEKLDIWRKKFPLGMALYETAGGVQEGEGDEFGAEDLEEMQRLVTRGADVNFQGPGMYTPLHFAALRGFTESVNLLLSKGAKVNAHNKWEWTPLHCAATEGHTEAVKALIAAGANLYSITRHTNLPLDEATGMEHWVTASTIKRAMGPEWWKWCRQSYHSYPGDEYVYDPIEAVPDDQIALAWQQQMRAEIGQDQFDRIMEGQDKLEVDIDPELHSALGYFDSDGQHHPPERPSTLPVEEESGEMSEPSSDGA